MRALPALVLVIAGCALPVVPARDGEDAVELRQRLIRFGTINPPTPESGRRNADETALLSGRTRISPGACS